MKTIFIIVMALVVVFMAIIVDVAFATGWMALNIIVYIIMVSAVLYGATVAYKLLEEMFIDE